MAQPKLRVLVAAEHAAFRQLLSDVLKEEPGVTVVGEAENSGKAITLSRTLRPDVALVDCHLPWAQGIDFNRLSRIAGLDTASVITEERQSTQAIVLVNINEAIFHKDALSLAPKVCFQKEDGTSAVALTLHQLHQAAPLLANPVFANVQVEERAAARPKLAAVAEDVLSVSGLTLMGGLCLIATFFLAPVGAVVALAGLGGLFLSLGMRAVAWVWVKQSSPVKVALASRSDSQALAQGAIPVQASWNGSKNGKKQGV